MRAYELYFGALLASVVSALGCGAPSLSAFGCESDEVCNLMSGGQCEPYGGATWCSYSDGACGSGRRWSEQATSAIAGACVGEESGPMNDGSVDSGVPMPMFHKKLDAGSSASPNDLFGASVATDGSVAVVSAMTDAGASETGSGSVFVFERTGATWAPFQTLSVGTGMAYRFGYSVAVSGDIIVVGAPGDNEIGSSAGAVYVFQRGPNNWAQVAKLTASGGLPYERFGQAVAAEDDIIVVGAPETDIAGVVSTGRVAVFTPTGAGGSWVQSDTFAAGSDNSMNLGFGVDVAVSGAAIAVGTLKDVVYVFEKNGTYTRTGKITAADVGSSATLDFGSVVDIDGEHLAIGAPSSTAKGEAVVTEKAGAWATTFMKLTASDVEEDGRFGGSIAIKNGHVVVGSPHAGTRDAGAAYFFTREGASYLPAMKLTASDGSANDDLGLAAAMSATDLIIGAGFDDQHGEASGSAYVWRLY